MMETFVNFACAHAHSAHWVFFLLLLLAGLNIPISEDIILLTGGAIASTCIPEETLYLFLWIYAGSWISAWEAYAIGRYLGPKLYDIRWFRHLITPEKIQRLHHYYEKFGVFTFIVGRFIPGGVRNALFITAGLGKMPFLKFILRDGFACMISASTIFYIGYTIGEQYQTIIHYVVTYNKVAAICALIATSAVIAVISWRYYYKKKYKVGVEFDMLTLPNLITLIRLPLALLFLYDSIPIRVTVLVLAMLSDAMDGYFARRYKNTSRAGTFLDPLADKVFVFAALGTLLSEGRLLSWEAITMLCRDFSVMVFAGYLMYTGTFSQYQFRAIWSGKVMTALQFIVLLCLTCQITLPPLVYFLFIALGLTALVELYLERSKLRVEG